MGAIDVHYHALLKHTLEGGYRYRTENRPDEDCIETPSVTLDIPLRSFPLLTTKEMFTQGIFEELLWFLRGQTGADELAQKGVNIWNKDAYNHYRRMCDRNGYRKISYEDFVQELKTPGTIKYDGEGDFTAGDLGPVYGYQWRNFGDTDQIVDALNKLKRENPITRRNIVTAWNPEDVPHCALPPCHWAFEFIVFPLSISNKIYLSGKDKVYLDTLWTEAYVKKNEEAKERLAKEIEHLPDYGFILKWHQRSCDLFLGIPFNIASYATLAYLFGELTGVLPFALSGDLSHVHIYSSHTEEVREQLNRKPNEYPSPILSFSERLKTKAKAFRENVITFDEFLKDLTHEDFIVGEYQSFPPLKAKMVAEKN